MEKKKRLKLSGGNAGEEENQIAEGTIYYEADNDRH